MVHVRAATPGDAPAVSRLLSQLGYEVAPSEVSTRLDALARSFADPVLVAAEESGAVLGVVALHWARMLFHGAQIARITTLVVDGQARGRGVGRLLVEAGAAAAQAAGCDAIELTTALRRSDAQAFYRSLGFEASSYRMSRALPM